MKARDFTYKSVKTDISCPKCGNKFYTGGKCWTCGYDK